MNDLEAIKKLDEAIQALKEAGYECTVFFSERNNLTDIKDYNKREIGLRCEKYSPVEISEEVTAIRNILNFSRN